MIEVPGVEEDRISSTSGMRADRALQRLGDQLLHPLGGEAGIARRHQRLADGDRGILLRGQGEVAVGAEPHQHGDDEEDQALEAEGETGQHGRVLLVVAGDADAHQGDRASRRAGRADRRSRRSRRAPGRPIRAPGRPRRPDRATARRATVAVAPS